MSIERPSRDSILMSSAVLWALRSTCSRAQVGVVIATKDYRPLVSGYNGAPAGMPHCDHSCVCPGAGYDDLLAKGHHLSICPATKPCSISVHGEANAIAYAAREGVSVKGGQLFSTVTPCPNCAMLIINSGIDRVVFKLLHRDMDGASLLDSAGVEVIAYKHG